MVQLIGESTEANIRVLAPLLYIVPLFILYLIIFFVMTCSKSQKQFNSWFLHYFKVGLLCNLGAVFFYYAYVRTSEAPIFLPMYSILPKTSFIITVAPFLSYYCLMASGICDAILALNRFSIFILKNRYKSFWRRCGVFFLLFILIFPGILNFHFFFTDVRIEPINASNPNDGYRWDQFKKENIPWMQNSRNNMILTCIVGGICILCNTFIIIKLCMKKYGYSSNGTTVDAQELKMIFYTIFCAIMHGLFVAQQVHLSLARMLNILEFR